MKKSTLIAAASAAFALTGCGSADDASEDAMADTVEMPADEALANTPDPVTDTASDAVEDATADAEARTDTAAAAGDAAVDAANDAAAAAEAATNAQ